MTIKTYSYGKSTTAFMFAIALLTANLAFAEEVLIQEVYVDNPTPGMMTIVGTGFSDESVVTFGTFGVIPSAFNSSTELEATLPTGPTGVVSGGQYLLLVTGTSEGSVSGCGVKGSKGSKGSKKTSSKPGALRFQYTDYKSCDDSDNDQDKKTRCEESDGALVGPVKVGMDPKLFTVEPSDGINNGDSFIIASAGSQLKSSTRLVITDADGDTQFLDIHTSCSAPLAVGDKFGSLELTGFFPVGTNPSQSFDEFDMIILRPQDPS